LRDLQSDVPFSRKDIIHIQDPLNLAMKNLQEFDHVKKGLQIPINNNNNTTGTGNVNTAHASDDLKRVLGSLGSTEAAAAFTGGGGGQRAQAERLLAEAKLHDKDKETGGNKEEEGDPRLRSEPRDLSQSNLNVLKKAGTATWNTEDLTAAFTAPPSASSLLAATGIGIDKNNDINVLTGGKKVPQPYSRRTITSVQTTGKTSRSLTSTTSTPATQNQRLLHTVQLKPTKKAYVRLHTNMGDLNIELHADMCPKTCENFVALVDSGYYNGTVFHRSVKNFMIQGGDPTGTGRGGVSIWGRTFENELDSRLKHDSRGVLGMANSGNGSGSGGGNGTNGSQFYILYKSAPHLDNKHTVFGRLVGGFDILTAMEKVPTTGDSGDEDRPVSEIEIVGASVFVNPYKELLDKEEEETKGNEEEERRRKVKRSKIMDGRGGGGGGGGGTSVAVGKYLAGDDGSIMKATEQAKGKSNAGTVALSAFDAW
jgi:peptidyl-prolyl cis-trans isomerase-like 2